MRILCFDNILQLTTPAQYRYNIKIKTVSMKIYVVNKKVYSPAMTDKILFKDLKKHI